MELIEIIGWIALGFIPAFGGLEIAGKKMLSRKAGKTVVLNMHGRGGETAIGL
jgi:hypothetical protein